MSLKPSNFLARTDLQEKVDTGKAAQLVHNSPHFRCDISCIAALRFAWLSEEPK